MAVNVTDLMRIPVSNTALSWAAYTALKKYPHTYMGTRRRTDMEKLDNLFQGDVAKSALIEYLQSQGVTISQEYDRIRTDNFVNPNSLGYHFIANQSKIECNSSLMPAGHTRVTAIDKDIKITAGDGTRIWTYPLAHHFDIAVQMYFDTNTTGITNQYNRQQIIVMSNQVQSPDDPIITTILAGLNAQNRFTNNLLGYGWATKNDVEQFRLHNEAHGIREYWNYTGNTRTYWNCKIYDTNPFRTLHTNV